jgi:SAM-dependent methyltransferase
MNYLHGYSQKEGQRLAAQAEFWRDPLILPGTTLAPGTRLLEIGCGVGAVLQILDHAFPDLALSGVDIEPAQIATARRRLDRPGIPVDLQVADGRDLPYADGSFDHVWIQFVLEHMNADDARKTLDEARRVLVPGGQLTAIEADYHTVRIDPDPDGLAQAMVRVMDAYGQSSAGLRLRFWLDEGGWSDIDPGAHHFGYQGAATLPVDRYLADVLEATGIQRLRREGTDSIEFTIYKATARA